jgi:thymidylate kinase
VSTAARPSSAAVERVRAALPERWSAVPLRDEALLQIGACARVPAEIARSLASAAQQVRPPGRLVAFERVVPGAHAAVVALTDGDAWTSVRLLVTAPDAGVPTSAVVERVERCAPTGAVVALYGVDGSGKTSLARALPELLARCFSGSDHWHRFTRQQSGVEYRAETNPHGKPPRSLAAGIAKVGWYTLQAWAVRTPSVRKARHSGRLIVLDRDLPDVWIDPRRYRLQAPEPLLRVFDRAAPRPDLAFVLDADAATVNTRSGELPYDTLAALLARYRSFAQGRSWVVVLDARRSASDVAREAAGHIVAHLERAVLIDCGAS